MVSKTGRIRRTRMIEDGYCIIPNVLDNNFLDELRQETNTLNDTLPHHPDTRFQGTHLVIYFEENQIMRRLSEWQPARTALEEMEFGDFVPHPALIILTKLGHDPALYWHQDWQKWEDPLSCSPWPQTIFLSYYLEDTAVENGCLRVIPGTHLKRIQLHDQMVPAHDEGARFIDENHPVMFINHPEQVDVEIKAGSLVIGDARLLHGTHRNQSKERRNLLLIWHDRPETIPQYWTDHVPQEILERDAAINYSPTRIPGKYLK